jgi:hypothetical protein
MNNLPTRATPAAKFSLVSILAVVAAVLSFKFGAALGLLLAIAAIVLGAIGAIIALLPGTRGGVLSVISIIAGLIGIIAAVFKLLGHLF